MSPLAPGEVVRIRGERWSVIEHVGHGTVALLRVGGCDRDNSGVHAQFLLPFERVERLPADALPRVVQPARWRRLARRELSAARPRIDSLRTAAGARIDLIPFQLEPAIALVRGQALRMLIADAVGLGKTVQAALVVAEALARVPGGHALVVCPAGLREQWQQELAERFGLGATVLDAAALAHHDSGYAENPWTDSPVVVTSIDYVKRPEVIRALESMVWDVLVLDEAHALAGRSDRALAAAALARRSRAVVMLTATPHSGDEGAFDRLCALGRLPADGPLLAFRRTRLDAGRTAGRRMHWFRVRSNAAERALHEALLAYVRLVWRDREASSGARLAMSVLLKRACSSAWALRRSLERRLQLLSAVQVDCPAQMTLPFDTGHDDEEPLAQLAAPGLADAREEQQRLEHLVALARLASERESKLGVLHRLLRRCPERAIVFTEYRDTLGRIAAALPHRTIVVLHGGLTAPERRAALDAFTRTDGAVLLATDAASEGLNLHRGCRLVVNMELPWTPLRLEQRIGRVDRIGQPRRVHAIHLIAGDTAEEQTVARLMARQAAAAAALAFAGDTTEDDILAALAGSAPPATAPGRAMPHLRTIDLRRDARDEVDSIRVSRLLAESASDRGSPRPALARVERRRPGRAGRYWLFRGTLVNAAGYVVWTAPLAIGAAPRPGSRARSARSIRRLLDPEHPQIRAAAAAAHAAACRDAAHALSPWLDISAARERDIADGIQRTRGRLALHQAGLFDRRAEREAAAQTAILDRALDRCSDRLDRLALLRALTPRGCALAFAVARG